MERVSPLFSNIGSRTIQKKSALFHILSLPKQNHRLGENKTPFFAAAVHPPVQLASGAAMRAAWELNSRFAFSI